MLLLCQGHGFDPCTGHSLKAGLRDHWESLLTQNTL